MIYLHWIVVLVFWLYVIVILATSAVVVMENRQPVKTMAWLLVLILLPVVGLVLFIFFGQDTRKEKYITQQSLDQLSKRSIMGFAEQPDLVIPEQYEQLVIQFSLQNVALPFQDNEVDVYTSGYEWFPALLHAISQARHHVHLITFIFADDPLGYLVSDALIDKAKQGVEVRVIYDDVGNFSVQRAFIERMREAGVDIHAFMPVRFPAFTSKINSRNHRKLCVVDGQVGFIGGMNIALRYVKGTEIPWRDTHLRIRGKAVFGIQTAFLLDWYFVDRSMVSGKAYFPEPEGVPRNGCLTQIVTSSPTSEWPELSQGYVRILMNARDYVYIETPYFMPTETVLFALCTCALSGVDVRLVVPKRGETKWVEWASRSYYNEVLQAGVKIFLYEGGYNHSKVLVCDDTVCSCGSANVDFRSFENNFEANAFIYDADTVRRMKEVVLSDLQRCKPLLLDDYKKRSLRSKAMESLTRLVSPLM